MSRTLSAIVVGALVLSGCGWPSTPVEPPIVEHVFHDASMRVRMTALDRGGFPDRMVEYHLVVDVMGGPTTELLTGQAQVQSVRGRARAARLASSSLAVAFRDELCVVDAAFARCVDLSRAGDPSFTEALVWRASDPASRLEERTRAAIVLAHLDPAAGLAATEPRGAPTGYDDLDAELDGTRALLTGDVALLRVLRSEMAGYSAVRLAGLARACVPALEADIRRARAGRSASSVALIDAALARCSPRAPSTP